mmetsp:Transcript_138993/g.387654  ORF Transcript_138993/g.387654 Transcript_138993/m.387654 type:complete len:275 (+) Transcript_138993:213-1037(+)
MAAPVPLTRGCPCWAWVGCPNARERAGCTGQRACPSRPRRRPTAHPAAPAGPCLRFSSGRQCQPSVAPARAPLMRGCPSWMWAGCPSAQARAGCSGCACPASPHPAAAPSALAPPPPAPRQPPPRTGRALPCPVLVRHPAAASPLPVVRGRRFPAAKPLLSIGWAQGRALWRQMNRPAATSSRTGRAAWTVSAAGRQVPTWHGWGRHCHLRRHLAPGKRQAARWPGRRRWATWPSAGWRRAPASRPLRGQPPRRRIHHQAPRAAKQPGKRHWAA